MHSKNKPTSVGMLRYALILLIAGIGVGVLFTWPFVWWIIEGWRPEGPNTGTISTFLFWCGPGLIMLVWFGISHLWRRYRLRRYQRGEFQQ